MFDNDFSTFLHLFSDILVEGYSFLVDVMLSSLLWKLG